MDGQKSGNLVLSRGEMVMRYWLEERVGLKKFWLQPIFPKGSAVWVPFTGILCLFLVLWQAMTGMMLALQEPLPKSPVAYLPHNLHWIGAHALMAAIFLHLITQIYCKGYAPPKELVWLSGICLLLLILASYALGPVTRLLAQDINSIECLVQTPLLGLIIRVLPKKNPGHVAWIAHICAIPFLTCLVMMLHVWLKYRITIIQANNIKANDEGNV